MASSISSSKRFAALFARRHAGKARRALPANADEHCAFGVRNSLRCLAHKRSTKDAGLNAKQGERSMAPHRLRLYALWRPSASRRAVTPEQPSSFIQAIFSSLGLALGSRECLEYAATPTPGCFVDEYQNTGARTDDSPELKRCARICGITVSRDGDSRMRQIFGEGFRIGALSSRGPRIASRVRRNSETRRPVVRGGTRFVGAWRSGGWIVGWRNGRRLGSIRCGLRRLVRGSLGNRRAWIAPDGFSTRSLSDFGLPAGSQHLVDARVDAGVEGFAWGLQANFQDVPAGEGVRPAWWTSVKGRRARMQTSTARITF